MLSGLPCAVLPIKVLQPPAHRSPVGASNIALPLGARCARCLHVDAVFGFEVVVEVSVSLVVAVVADNCDVPEVRAGWARGEASPELGPGECDGGQGEDHQLVRERSHVWANSS